MAYDQRQRNGGTPGPYYEHQRIQKFSYGAHQPHANTGYSYDDYNKPAYNPTDHNPDKQHVPRRNGGDEYNGGWGRNDGTRQNGGMPQNEGMRRLPMQQPQQTAMKMQRPMNQESQGYGNPQPNHQFAEHSPKPPQAREYQQQNKYQQSSTHRSAQNSPARQREYQPEPYSHNWSPEQANGGHYTEIDFREPQNGPIYNANAQQYAVPENVYSTNHMKRPQDRYQQQHNSDVADGVQINGGVGSYGYGNSSKPVSSHGQRRKTPPKAGNGQHVKPKRSLGNSPDPEMFSWDSPFPTFPLSRKKVNEPIGNDLNGDVAGMSLHNDPRDGQAHDQRPQTGNSKSSQSSSHQSERRLNTAQTQEYLSPRHQLRQDFSGEKSGSHYEHSERQQNTQTHAYNSVDVAYDPPRSQPSSWGPVPMQYDDQREASAISNRRLEDASTAPPHHPKAAFIPSSQRSSTMPNSVLETAVSSGPLDHAGTSNWPEPGPNAGYYGPDGREFLQTQPLNTSKQNPAGQPRSQSDIGRHGEGYGLHPETPAQPPPHGPQDSLSELFDSYYDPSPQGQESQSHSGARQHQPTIDDDMPDFDAVPDTGNGHRRGMTIDQHLGPQHQQRAPEMPQIPAQYRRGDIGVPQPGHHAMKKFPRSKSSPNLKDQRLPGNHIIDGFNFGMPEVVHAVPPSPGDYNGPMTHGSNVYSNPRQQDTRKQAGIRSYERSIPSSSPQRNEGQSISPYGQHGSPVPQTGHYDNGQGRQSYHRPSPANQIGLTSPPKSPLSKPDALPKHPAPIRAGLMPGSPAKQAPKPAPTRQYNNGSSPLHQVNPSRQPEISRPRDEKRSSMPVTHEELERLRQIIGRSPSDQKTQLILAKKMVEAASVLIDERADQRTKSKTREKYILDAHKIVKKLVNNGYPDASFYLADCYSRGFLGLETDTKEAFNLYQSAAKAGHPQAAYRVAVCCEMGQEEGGGTKRDPLKAMQWYKRAATLGDPPAMYKMGIIQLKGLLGQPKNIKEAINWLKRAAERADEENPHALHELGLLHENAGGDMQVIEDEAYSKQLFTQAAKLGYKFSQFRLGSAYEYGLMGCTVDPRQSIAWYSKAAVQEEHQSELALSGWYLTGSEGVLQQSDIEAYLWARKAAQAGLPKAEYAMGYFTEVGIGAPANIEDAKRWYWRSASQNFPKARDRLEDLRKGGAKMQKSRVSRSAVNKQSEGDCIVM